jgi:hypothetical protein
MSSGTEPPQDAVPAHSCGRSLHTLARRVQRSDQVAADIDLAAKSAAHARMLSYAEQWVTRAESERQKMRCPTDEGQYRVERRRAQRKDCGMAQPGRLAG